MLHNEPHPQLTIRGNRGLPSWDGYVYIVMGNESLKAAAEKNGYNYMPWLVRDPLARTNNVPFASDNRDYVFMGFAFLMVIITVTIVSAQKLV